MNGEWRPIHGYEGIYQISDFGDVRRSTGELINGSLHSKGYRRACLSKHGVVKYHFVHALVAAAFIGPRPHGQHVDHIDGDKLNNTAENLRYCTPKENIENSVRLGLNASGERNAANKLTQEQVEEIVDRYENGGRYWGRNELARKFGVQPSTIQRSLDNTIAASIRTLITKGEAR